jgi:hypothetical protein
MTVASESILPKWQAGRGNCQNGRRSKSHATKNIFFSIFFCLTFKMPMVKYRYKDKKERGNDD